MRAEKISGKKRKAKHVIKGEERRKGRGGERKEEWREKAVSGKDKEVEGDEREGRSEEKGKRRERGRMW